MYAILSKLESIEQKLDTPTYRGIIDDANESFVAALPGLMSVVHPHSGKHMTIALVVNDTGDGYLIANPSQDSAIKKFNEALKNKNRKIEKMDIFEKAYAYHYKTGSFSYVVEDSVYYDPNYKFCIQFENDMNLPIKRMAMASRLNNIWRYFYIAQVKPPEKFLFQKKFISEFEALPPTHFRRKMRQAMDERNQKRFEELRLQHCSGAYDEDGSPVPIDKNTIHVYTMGSFVISVDDNVGKYLGLPADYLAYYN